MDPLRRRPEDLVHAPLQLAAYVEGLAALQDMTGACSPVFPPGEKPIIRCHSSSRTSRTACTPSLSLSSILRDLCAFARVHSSAIKRRHHPRQEDPLREVADAQLGSNSFSLAKTPRSPRNGFAVLLHDPRGTMRPRLVSGEKTCRLSKVDTTYSTPSLHWTATKKHGSGTTLHYTSEISASKSSVY